MDKQELIEFLTRYNEWRRFDGGGESPAQPSPKEVGKAIDLAIKLLSTADDLNSHAGWVLVPVEPTWDMRNEGREFLIDGIEKEPEKLAYFLWKTMVSASPKELEKRDTAIDKAIAGESP